MIRAALVVAALAGIAAPAAATENQMLTHPSTLARAPGFP